MSACDTCPVPGHCCRAIILGGGAFARDCATTEEAEAFMEQARTGAVRHEGRMIYIAGKPMPFRPLFKRTDGAWSWWCPNLSVTTGRCLDYENRPGACHHYQPGDDAMCVLTKEAA